MEERTLFEIAEDMLESTNPYSRSVSDLSYSYTEAKTYYDINFLNELQKYLRTKRHSNRKVGAQQKDLEICYEAIVQAMITYIENYPAQSYSYKQSVKKQFSEWLIKIAHDYNIPEKSTPDELKVKEADTAIAMIKELHSRKGTTVNAIAEAMDITTRAVQKNLNKLDPSLSTSTANASQFSIGGQPVKLDITSFPGEESRGPRYRTTNTMHPLVLLENQMQIGVLLQSLAQNYSENGSDVCYSIGLDIWYQLSDYAKDRVKRYFTKNDSSLKTFIDLLEQEIPDSRHGKFQTERSMFRHIIPSKNELLTFILKGEGRRCNIILRGLQEELISQQLEFASDEEKDTRYRAIAPDGTIHEFDIDDIEDIEIEELLF